MLKKQNNKNRTPNKGELLNYSAYSKKKQKQSLKAERWSAMKSKKEVQNGASS